MARKTPEAGSLSPHPLKGTCSSSAAFLFASSPLRSYLAVVWMLACPAILCTVADWPVLPAAADLPRTCLEPSVATRTNRRKGSREDPMDAEVVALAAVGDPWSGGIPLPENPRVGGSTPSGANSLQALLSPQRFLWGVARAACEPVAAPKRDIRPFWGP